MILYFLFEKDITTFFRYKIAPSWNILSSNIWYAGPIIKAARGGHRERLCKEAKLNCVQRKNFQTNRVVNQKNKLDDATVQAPLTNSFKNRVNANHNGCCSS